MPLNNMSGINLMFTKTKLKMLKANTTIYLEDIVALTQKIENVTENST